jgi:hypothetical protein
MTRHRSRFRRLNSALLMSLLPMGCATAPPRAKVVAPVVESSTPSVQRLQLRVAPLEIVTSGVRAKAQTDSIVTVKNVDASAVILQSFKLVGDGLDVFSLVNPLGVSKTLMPGQSAEAVIRFAPSATATVGVHRVTLQIFLAQDDLGPLVDIAGLVTQGEAGEMEPPLAQVVDALGYHMNVGGPQLVLGNGPALVGDEVLAPRFVRANPGPVAVDPVARYSSEGSTPYGYFRVDAAPKSKPKLESLGQLAAEQFATLNPDAEGEGHISFDPGPLPFGLYVQSGKQMLFTESALNKGPAKHATRVFPLKSRNNETIPNAYLVAFEEAANGDYQDYVFVVWNVNAVSP